MHCSITFALLFVCLGAANAANSLRGADERELAAKKRRVAICTKINDGQYETRFVAKWAAALASTSFKGACVDMCATLCVDFASFDTSNHKCMCAVAAAPEEEAAVEPCAKNPCASNQVCVEEGASFKCEAAKCANPFGNPCGTGSACKDTPTGFTCESLISSDVCPGGCGPNSACVSGQCKCDAGFARPKPYLGCEATP